MALNNSSLENESDSPTDAMPMKLNEPFTRLFDVGVNQETVHFRVNIFNGDLKAIETASFRDLNFWAEFLHLDRTEIVEGQRKWRELTKFSPTMPSLAAKKAKTFLMKYCSSDVKRSQSFISLAKSTSSQVQIDARARL